MRLNMEEGFLKQITTEQVRQNLALLKAEEIEIPKKWVLEMVNTIEALQQENEQLKANALLDVVNSDIVKSYDGSALERADQYIERLEAERDEFQRRLTGEIELHAQQGAEITRLEEENEQLKAQLDAMSILSDEYAKRLKLQEENEQLRAQVVRMREVLDEIANPIKYMREKAEKEGKRLDGGIAIALSESASYLKGIAEEALTEIDKAIGGKANEQM